MPKARTFCRHALQGERLLFNVPKIPWKTENKLSTSEPRNKVNHQAPSPYSSKLEVTYGEGPWGCQWGYKLVSSRLI